MKKALCFLLAIIFVACVFTYNQNERFSLALMIENLTNFEDMPTIADVADCWSADYYCESSILNLPHWVDYYFDVDDELYWDDYSSGYYKGEFPVAWDRDCNFLEKYRDEVLWINLITPTGEEYRQSFKKSDGSYYTTAVVPIIKEPYQPYNEYSGNNEVNRFFSGVKEFFVRLWQCVSKIFRMFTSVFSNLRYLLPWNNTVSTEG